MLITDMTNNDAVFWSWLDTAQYQLHLYIGGSKAIALSFLVPVGYRKFTYTVAQHSLTAYFFQNLIRA